MTIVTSEKLEIYDTFLYYWNNILPLQLLQELELIEGVFVIYVRQNMYAANTKTLKQGW